VSQPYGPQYVVIHSIPHPPCPSSPPSPKERGCHTCSRVSSVNVTLRWVVRRMAPKIAPAAHMAVEPPPNSTSTTCPLASSLRPVITVQLPSRRPWPRTDLGPTRKPGRRGASQGRWTDPPLTPQVRRVMMPRDGEGGSGRTGSRPTHTHRRPPKAKGSFLHGVCSRYQSVPQGTRCNSAAVARDPMPCRPRKVPACVACGETSRSFPGIVK